MIIRIFKLSTAQLCTIRHKAGLIKYIYDEVNKIPSNNLTIKQMMQYLPVEEYYWINKGGHKK